MIDSTSSPPPRNPSAGLPTPQAAANASTTSPEPPTNDSRRQHPQPHPTNRTRRLQSHPATNNHSPRNHPHPTRTHLTRRHQNPPTRTTNPSQTPPNQRHPTTRQLPPVTRGKLSEAQPQFRGDLTMRHHAGCGPGQVAPSSVPLPGRCNLCGNRADQVSPASRRRRATPRQVTHVPGLSRTGYLCLAGAGDTGAGTDTGATTASAGCVRGSG